MDTNTPQQNEPKQDTPADKPVNETVKMPKLKLPPLSANTVMIAIGGFIVLLLIVSGLLRGYAHVRLAKKCKNGDINVCTALIEAKGTPDKEAGMYYAVRGYYYDQKGEYDKALSDFSSAITVTSGQTQASIYANRGSTFIKKAQYNEAISDFSSAIRIVPQVPGLYCSRANAEYHKGDAASGDADLAQAKKMAPGLPCIAQLEQARQAPPPDQAPAQPPAPAAGSP